MITAAVTYRSLLSDEVAFLTPKLKDLGWVIPHPNLATAIVAESEGKIVGFVITQCVMHAEPEWVDSAFRGSGVAEELAERAADLLKQSGAKGWVVIATNPFAEKLCRHVGMDLVPGTLYRKET